MKTHINLGTIDLDKSVSFYSSLLMQAPISFGGLRALCGR